jgi:hypothetical protein
MLVATANGKDWLESNHIKVIPAAWDSSIKYKKGDFVSYNANIYECRQGFTDYHDPNWKPDVAQSLWLLIPLKNARIENEVGGMYLVGDIASSGRLTKKYSNVANQQELYHQKTLSFGMDSR